MHRRNETISPADPLSISESVKKDPAVNSQVHIVDDRRRDAVSKSGIVREHMKETVAYVKEERALETVRKAEMRHMKEIETKQRATLQNTERLQSTLKDQLERRLNAAEYQTSSMKAKWTQRQHRLDDAEKEEKKEKLVTRKMKRKLDKEKKHIYKLHENYENIASKWQSAVDIYTQDLEAYRGEAYALHKAREEEKGWRSSRNEAKLLLNKSRKAEKHLKLEEKSVLDDAEKVRNRLVEALRSEKKRVENAVKEGEEKRRDIVNRMEAWKLSAKKKIEAAVQAKGLEDSERHKLARIVSDAESKFGKSVFHEKWKRDPFAYQQDWAWNDENSFL